MSFLGDLGRSVLNSIEEEAEAVQEQKERLEKRSTEALVRDYKGGKLTRRQQIAARQILKERGVIKE